MKSTTWQTTRKRRNIKCGKIKLHIIKINNIYELSNDSLFLSRNKYNNEIIDANQCNNNKVFNYNLVKTIIYEEIKQI